MKVDIKTKAEIDRMREACRMTAEIRDICANAVAPGVTTGDIDDLVEEYCAKNKVRASFFNYMAFLGGFAFRSTTRLFTASRAAIA